MKLKLTVILFFLVLSYLYFTYTRIYFVIGQANLQSPAGENIFTLENPAKSGEVKYVALGDSLSAGVGGTWAEESIAYQFGQKLAKTTGKVSIINLAIPGATTKDLINNQLSPAILENPDYVTILIGINDLHNLVSQEDFRNNYRFILTQLQTKTKAQIICLNLPYLGSNKLVYPPYNLILDFRTKQFNTAISSLVEIKGAKLDRVKLIDLYGGAYEQFRQNPKFYSADYFHPSGEGYLLWGQIINAD